MAEEDERPDDPPEEPDEAPEETAASSEPADEKPAAGENEDQPTSEKQDGEPGSEEEKAASEEKPASGTKEQPPAAKEDETSATEEEEEEKPPMSSNEDTQSFAANPDAAAEQVQDIRPDIPAFRVPRENLLDAMTYLQQELGYDHLACITALDWKEGNLEVVYNLWSYAKNRPLAVRVPVSADDAVVPSVTSLWKGADWLEREEYDLMGIRFDGHPDLRRIMLPEGWDGHPLRKDYDLKREQYVGMNDEGDDVVYAEPREDAW